MNIQSTSQPTSQQLQENIGIVANAMFNSYRFELFDHNLNESHATTILNRVIEKINEISINHQIPPLVGSSAKNPATPSRWDWDTFVTNLYLDRKFFQNNTNRMKFVDLSAIIQNHLTKDEINIVTEETNKVLTTTSIHPIGRGVYSDDSFDVYELFTKYGQRGASLDIFIKNAIKLGFLPEEVINKIYSTVVS